MSEIREDYNYEKWVHQKAEGFTDYAEKYRFMSAMYGYIAEQFYEQLPNKKKEVWQDRYARLME